MTIVRAVLATALVFAVTACGRYPEHPVQPTHEAGTTVRTVLHRSDPVHEEPLPEVVTVDAGEPAPLVNWGETIGTFTFKGFKVGGADGGANFNFGPWLSATLHLENWSHKKAILPVAGIRCAGSTQTDDLLIGSWPTSVEVTEDHLLPAGRSTDWNVMMGLPENVGPGRTCKTPAYVAVTALGDFVEKDPVSRVRIPDELIDELNALRTHGAGGAACAGPLPTC